MASATAATAITDTTMPTGSASIRAASSRVGVGLWSRMSSIMFASFRLCNETKATRGTCGTRWTIPGSTRRIFRKENVLPLHRAVERLRPLQRPPRRSPACRRFLVDGDEAVLDGDVAARAQVAEDAAHHVARGANALGDLLLRDLVGDVQLAVFLLHGEVEQQARHAPVHVEQRRSFTLLVATRARSMILEIIS